jgi:DNA replication protein DnaC
MELATETKPLVEELLDYWEKDFAKTLPANYRERFPQNIDDKPISDFLSSYDWLNDPFGLLIMGKAGVGKTWILTAIMNDVLRNCYAYSESMAKQVAYYPASYLIYLLRNRNDAAFQNAITVSFLFLDDFGSENVTDFAREHFFTILDIRCQKQKPTFITTNLNFNEISTKYGERFVSRLKEMCIPMSVDGNDKRSEIAMTRANEFKQRKYQSLKNEGAETT